MKLKDVYKIITEQMPQTQMAPAMPMQGMDPNMGMMPQQPPVDPNMAQQPTEQPSVIELPQINMTVSVFPTEKKLLFSPQDHKSLTSKTRTYVNMLKQNFRVIDSNVLGLGQFELLFDPREDFNGVINFITQMAQLSGQ